MKRALLAFTSLNFKQKLSLVGLMFLGISLPVSIVASALQTRSSSRAFETTLSQQNRIEMRAPKNLERLVTPITSDGPIIAKTSKCRIGGCNSELCLGINDPEMFSTCAITDNQIAEQACRHQFARCEMQSTGSCGWSYDPQYHTCVGNTDQPKLAITPSATPYINPSTMPPKIYQCGDGICERSERSITICTKSLPPQCTTTPGSCPKDCMDVVPQPSITECTLECKESERLNSQSCLCEPSKEVLLPPATIPPKTKNPQWERVCENTGGQVRELNGCGDSCDVLTDALVACPADQNTPSCDCGPSKCWNGSSCVRNPKVKKEKDRLSVFGFGSWFGGVSSFFDSFFK